jgi:FixH
MVYVASRQTNEMMDDHYYEKELAHQSLINASQNLETVSKVSIFTQTEKEVHITIPTGLYAEITDGSIQFLRNSDQTKDYTALLQPNTSSGIQTISKEKFIKGIYKARIKWRSKGQLYYFEKDIFMQ